MSNAAAKAPDRPEPSRRACPEQNRREGPPEAPAGPRKPQEAPGLECSAEPTRNPDSQAPPAEPISPDSLSAPLARRRRRTDGKYAPGNPGGPGRPRGKRNRINAVLKDDFLEAYQQRGGVEWLRRLKARDFVRLLEKTMPREVSADLRMATDPRNVKIIVEHVEVLPTGQEEVIDTYVLPAPGQNQQDGRDAKENT